MKFTLSWLKQHLETDAALPAIVDKLTLIGLEVERVEDKGKALAPFSIARVISAEPHPNADRLRVCVVDTGAGDPVQVVCGAPNARAGMKGVFVAPGAFIPGKNMTLGVGTIRGVESRGMLCSAFELQLSDDHEGIIELPADAPVGVPYAQWAGLDDPVIEINLTPNRPDCTGVHGIARDLAAADIGSLKEIAIKPIKGAFPCPVTARLDFAATPSLCRGFALRLVKGVKNGPSPDWLARRLIAIGLRPINTLVDITNFITFDRGRPLHVFDAAKVRGNLVVRRARAGESLIAIDGKTYRLDDSMCVIADDAGPSRSPASWGAKRPAARRARRRADRVGGIGQLNIAQTGRKLGISSDARYRFERGVDPAFMLPGLELATTMVLDLCGGSPSANLIAAAPDHGDRVIEFPLDTVKRLAGVEVALPELRSVLTRLGFFVAGAGPSVKIAPPSWRPDVHGKPDIVEEVIRIIGVDRIPATPFDRGAAPRKPVLTRCSSAPARPSGRWRRAAWWRPSPGRSSPSRRQSCSAAASPSSRSPIRSRWQATVVSARTGPVAEPQQERTASASIPVRWPSTLPLLPVRCDQPPVATIEHNRNGVRSRETRPAASGRAPPDRAARRRRSRGRSARPPRAGAPGLAWRR